MKKIIPTIFATVLAISSVSLLIGCDQGPPVDPDAKAKQDQEATQKDIEITDDEKKKFDADISAPDEPGKEGK